MQIKKAFPGIFNFAFLALLASALYIFISGGGKYIIGGIKISMSSPISPLIYSIVFLFINILLKESRSSGENILEKTADLFFVIGDSDSKKLFFSSILFFLLAGIFLGVDNYGTSSIVFEGVNDFKSYSQPYSERLSNIEVLVIYYGTISFLIGTLAFFLLIPGGRFLARKELKNPLLLLFSSAFLFLLIVLRNATDVFEIIKSESEIIPTFSDVALFTVLIFLIFYCIPLFSSEKNKIKTIGTVILTIIVFSIYPSLAQLEENRINNELNSNHRRIILITIDTLRADHLSSDNYVNKTTPFIDSVAEKGLRFANAYSQIPTTDPSHASILTGKYPRTHGLLMNAAVLPQNGIPSLQEWFKKQGYATAAITSRVFLDPKRMGTTGFDYINTPVPKKEITRRADSTYNRAMKWIEHNYYKDMFLWVHFWDPHYKYKPIEPYNSKFNKGYIGQYKRIKDINGFFINPDKRYSAEEVKYITSLYDGEIAFTDVYIEKLFNFFKDILPDNVEQPLFIITADHGETLGEIQDSHRYAFRHAKLVRYGSIHIPLIIQWEGVLPEGKVYDEVVGSVDIAPTIVSLVSEGKEQFKCDGKSFAGFLLNSSEWKKNTEFSQRRLYTEIMENTEFLNAREYGVSTDKWFLVTNEILGTELYNIKDDPLEQDDISSKEKDIVDDLLKRLEEWEKEYPEIKPFTGDISEEKTRTLKSLGYL